jgi:hypothetical protein
MLALGFLFLAGLAVGAAMLLALPVLIVLAVAGVVLKVLFFVLFLPLRALGWGIGFAFGALGLLLVLPLLLIGLLPLVPLLLIGLVLYLMLRPSRSRGVTARPVS